MNKKKLKLVLLTVCTAIAAAVTVRLARPAAAETTPSGGDAAYAVFNDSTGELDFIRSTESHANGETGTVTSISGGTYTGTIFTGFETASADVSYYPFQKIAASVKAVNFIDAIRPVSCAHWFENMTQCTDIVLDKLDTANVTNMGWMFNGCSSLTSLNVSNFNTANVMYMGYMFKNCSRLTSLDVSGFDTANVTDMRGMFERCSSLTFLDVSGFDTAKVTDMKWMFNNCSSLTSLDISKFNTANVKFTYYPMFSNCSKLQTVKIGTKFTMTINLTGFYKIADADGNQVIDEKAYDLSELSQTTTPSLAGTWSKTPLKAILSPTFKTVDGFTENAASFSHGTKEAYEANKANAKEIQANSSTSKIYMWHDADSHYYWYSPLDTVYLPSNCSDLFSYNERLDRKTYTFFTNKKLVSIDLSGLNWSEVTSTRKMFACLQGLTTLNLGDVDTSHVTDMYGMFGKISVPTLDVSKLNTSNVTCMDAMFYGAHTQNVIGLENFDTSKVTSMAGMFMDSYITNLDNIKGWDVTHVAEFDEKGHFEIVGTRDGGVDGGIFAFMSHLDSIDLSGWQVSKDKGLFFGWGGAHFTKIRFGTGFEGFIYGTDPKSPDSGCPMYKVEDANGNPMKDFRVHNLNSVKQPYLAGLWVKTAPEPYKYKLAVQDADGNPVKAYTLSETDTYVADVKAGDDGGATQYSTWTGTSKDTITTGAASIAMPDEEFLYKLDTTSTDTRDDSFTWHDVADKTAPMTNTYTINIVPAMGSGLGAKAVSISVDYNKHDYEITSDATLTKGVTYDDATKTLTITLDKDNSDDSASDKGDYRYWSKQDVVEVGASDDFMLKLNTPATTGLTYDATDTSGDMTYGILLDTVPGIAAIPAKEDDASWTADKQILSDWAKTWTVKAGDTTLTDEQKSAALQGYTPVLTVADNGTAVAGVKLDLTYLESIGLAGQRVEITMPHTVVADKLKEGKYTTKVYIYSDTAYEAMYTATTAVNATKDPYDDDGSSLTGDGKGRIHIFNAVYGTNAPARDFTFKITPDSDDAPLPAGADIATDADGKKYATVKIRGNGCYTGTMIFDKGGNYGYTITTVDDKADGWTTDATTYHIIYGAYDGWNDGKLHVGSWIGDVSIDGTKLNTRSGDGDIGAWNDAAAKSYNAKIERVRQKVFNQVSVVGTCVVPNARGFGFEQSYQAAPTNYKPMLSKARFARMAYVRTPSTDYDLAIFKKVTGTAIPDNYHFTATITPDDANCPMPTNADSWYDATNHTITLDNSDGGRARVLHFTTTTSGTYGYTVKETNDGKYGWDYDTHTYHVTYTIADGKATAVQTVDGTAITDSEKTDHAADYSDYTGETPTSQDALVEITNHHYQVVVPSGVFDNKAWIVIAAGAVVIVALCFVMKRKKR